jgi:hypothetical protein
VQKSIVYVGKWLSLSLMKNVEIALEYCNAEVKLSSRMSKIPQNIVKFHPINQKSAVPPFIHRMALNDLLY